MQKNLSRKAVSKLSEALDVSCISPSVVDGRRLSGSEYTEETTSLTVTQKLRAGEYSNYLAFTDLDQQICNFAFVR